MFRRIPLTQLILVFAFLSQCAERIPRAEALSEEWARYIHANPGGAGKENDAESIAQATSMQKEGYGLYRAKKDPDAIKKYEAAILVYASPELYFDYGNSLSNIPGRLEDSITAYKIGVALSTKPTADLLYNLACAQSRANQVDKALESLSRAYAEGKAIAVMEADADLINVRRNGNWKDRVTASKSSAAESESSARFAGKMSFDPASSGGNRSIALCRDGSAEFTELSQMQVRKLEKRGKWTVTGNGKVKIEWQLVSGERGVGQPTCDPTGVCGSYPSYEKFTEAGSTETFSWPPFSMDMAYSSDVCEFRK